MRFICATNSKIFRPKLKSWSKLKIKNSEKLLLYPEGRVVLNDTAYDILNFCDGNMSIKDICYQLSIDYVAEADEKDVQEFLDLAKDNLWIE